MPKSTFDNTEGCNTLASKLGLLRLLEQVCDASTLKTICQRCLPILTHAMHDIECPVGVRIEAMEIAVAFVMRGCELTRGG